MRKTLKHIFLAGTILTCNYIFSQPAINGPLCGLPGTTYLYSFTNTGTWTGTATMRVCINGGSIVNRDQVRIGTCAESVTPLANVLVMWNDTTQGSVTITAPSGNKTVNVSLTSALQPGLLNSLTVEQNFTDTVSIPSPILCSPAAGGSCSPNYLYQWQRSGDRLIWTNVTGSTGINLSFNTPARRTVYYRRKITENGSGTIGYSATATINVLVAVQPGSN
jgi:hypothetical protein